MRPCELPAAIPLMLTAAVAADAEEDRLEAARGFKREAIEHLKRSQAGGDRLKEGRKALVALNKALKLLKMYKAPQPREVIREIEEATALVYWTRKMMPVGGPDPPKVVAVETSSADLPEDPEEAARGYFGRAQEYARRSPGNLFVIAVRYFEVADRFPGTTWGLKAMRASLEYQRRLLAGEKPDEQVERDRRDPGRPEEPAADVDREKLVAGLSGVLRPAELPPEEKIQACDRFVRRLPGDPLRKEVEAVKAVLAAGNAEGRAAAARAYFEKYPQGRFAGDLDILRRFIEEEQAFKDLVVILRSGAAERQKLKFVRGFVKRFKSGGRGGEAAALEVVFSARSQGEKVAAWLEYRASFPKGALKEAAEKALRRAEPQMLALVGRALAEGDDGRVADRARVFLELSPKGMTASEVRSLLELVGTPQGPERSRAADGFLKKHPTGVFARVIRNRKAEWRRADAEAAFRDLVGKLAASRSREERLRMLRSFLDSHPQSDHAAEARAALPVFGTGSARTRLAAAGKYMEAYPAGVLAGAVREAERTLRRSREEELYGAAKREVRDGRDLAGAAAACCAYLAEFPGGAHAKEVRGLEKEARNLIQEEKRAFERLEAKLSGLRSPKEGVALCEEFLKKYPGGANATRARTRRQGLLLQVAKGREAEAHCGLMQELEREGLTRIEKADRCLAFLRKYRTTRHRGEIREALVELAPHRLGEQAGRIRAAAFSPDSRHLVISDADSRVRDTGVSVWKLPELRLLARYRVEPEFTVRSAAFLPEKNTLLLGEENGSLAVLYIVRGKVLGRYRLGARPVTAVSAAPGGKTVYVACSGDPKARAWDTKGWLPTGRALACPGGASALAVSPLGKMLAVGGRDGRLLVFGIGKRNERSERDRRKPMWSVLEAHKGEIDCVAFSPDGRHVASASRADGAVSLWGAGSGKRLWKLEERSPAVAFVDARTLLTGPSIRSVADGRVVAKLRGGGPVAASPDGRFAFTAHDTRYGTVWYLPALPAK